MLYDRAAAAYDLIIRNAHDKDYAAEADRVADLVRAHQPRAQSVLDVACGNGSHLARLAKRFRTAAGVELSAAMIAEAGRRHPGLEITRGDMRTFRLHRTFDAVTCLFGSIGYMTTIADLRRAVANLAAHLSPGGVLVVESWVTPEKWESGRVGADAAADEGMAACRIVLSRRTRRCSEMEMHYLVTTGERVERVVEVHRMGLFSGGEYRGAFGAAGLRSRTVRGLLERPVYVGT